MPLRQYWNDGLLMPNSFMSLYLFIAFFALLVAVTSILSYNAASKMEKARIERQDHIDYLNLDMIRLFVNENLQDSLFYQ